MKGYKEKVKKIKVYNSQGYKKIYKIIKKNKIKFFSYKKNYNNLQKLLKNKLQLLNLWNYEK